MPRVPIASEDERKFIVDGIQVGNLLPIFSEKSKVFFFFSSRILETTVVLAVPIGRYYLLLT
jgi:hypothetical protein